MPILWRPRDRHRNIRTWTRSARFFARRNQDRHVMIEIASPATPQLSSLLPPRRRRTPNDAPSASREHGRGEKYDPIADREHYFATLYPSNSSLTVIPTARQQTPATLKSQYLAAAATLFRLAVSFLGGFRTSAPPRNPSGTSVLRDIHCP